jgi:hypothetical protein
VPGLTVDSDSAAKSNTQLLFSLLKAFRSTFVEGSHPCSVADKLFQRIVGRVFEQSREALLSPTQDKNSGQLLDVLLDLVNVFGDNLFNVVDQAEVGVLVMAKRHSF